MYGRDVFLVGQRRPDRKRARPKRNQIFGFPSIYNAYALCRRTTKFDVVTHVGEGHVTLGQPRLPSHTAEFQRSPIFV